MADSIMSITIRDTRRPCAPYQTSVHSFKVYIYHCDRKPLWWRGINYGGGVLLTVPGQKRGRIHGQFKVPPGCYLVRAVAPCQNVFTEWAYVGVGCNETVCVNLVPSSLKHCLRRMIPALQLGTVAVKGEEEAPLTQLMPGDVKAAVALLEKIANSIRDESNLPEPLTVAEIKKAVAEPKSRREKETPE